MIETEATPIVKGRLENGYGSRDSAIFWARLSALPWIVGGCVLLTLFGGPIGLIIAIAIVAGYVYYAFVR